MAKDEHLGSGEYNPQKYWEARAKTSQGNDYQAVCGFGLSDTENAAMDKIQKAVLDSLLRSIDLRVATVMELGCGVARWAPFIHRRGALYVGVDASESMMEMAKTRVPESQFYRINSEKLPFHNDNFDGVFSITVLHHNSWERQRKIIEEMVRVTKPGGFILLMEGIASERKQTSFNMFPRPVEDWVAELERGGRVQLVKLKLARWWLLRDAAFKLMSMLGMRKANREGMKLLNSLFVRGGGSFDRYFLWLLPRRFATNAAMLFVKRGKVGHL